MPRKAIATVTVCVCVYLCAGVIICHAALEGHGRVLCLCAKHLAEAMQMSCRHARQNTFQNTSAQPLLS
eukprot:364639-Chlamydomonas_euryale.AAC.44